MKDIYTKSYGTDVQGENKVTMSKLQILTAVKLYKKTTHNIAKHLFFFIRMKDTSGHLINN